jgi:hypothetical protein
MTRACLLVSVKVSATLTQRNVKAASFGYSGCAGCAHHRPKGFFVKEYSYV